MSAPPRDTSTDASHHMLSPQRTVRVVRATSTSRVFSVLFVAGIAILAWLPAWGSVSAQRKMVELLTYIALAQMWNLLAGFAGLASVGQQAFVGLGAYGMVVLVNNLGVNLFVAVPIAAVAAAVVSVPMGLVAFRLRGSYFAIGTWVLAEVAALFMINNTKVGGGSGTSLKVAGVSIRARQNGAYWLALVAGVGAVLLSYGVVRSRLGLRLQAIRDNEAGARGLGANVHATRFAVWVLAAFVTAFAASVYFINAIRVQPAGTGGAFSVVQWTAPFIFMVVIGGIGTIEGPVIGALLYYFFRDRFSNSSAWYLITLGVIAVVVALWVQQGIWGAIRKRLGIDLFPVRRRVALDLSADTAATSKQTS
jgi:branched-chain amino acid transport system permease protein